jgi:DNA-binding XRE family transcriptional regulator
MSKADLKWYTLEEVRAKAMKKKGFKGAYEGERERRALARQVRSMRTNKRMTQAAVAQKAAMPQSAVARLESGDHGISLDTLSRVAHALGKRIEIV